LLDEKTNELTNLKYEKVLIDQELKMIQEQYENAQMEAEEYLTKHTNMQSEYRILKEKEAEYDKVLIFHYMKSSF
jgi:hypothetical protein